jgi:D-sedoheptulose 7-phosphate isomerase
MKTIFPKKKYKNVLDYYEEYSKILNTVLKKNKSRYIQKFTVEILNAIKKNQNIFIAGNGGCDSICGHFLCDFQKGLYLDKNFSIRMHDLCSNRALNSAISNDINYDKVFSIQLEILAKKNDIILLLSASGKSKNLINALKVAKRKKLKILSITGFSDNYVYKNSDIGVCFGIENYGLSEDAIQIFMHVISQYLRQTNQKKKITL